MMDSTNRETKILKDEPNKVFLSATKKNYFMLKL